MKRKFLSTAFKEWVFLVLLATPFLTVSLWLWNIELKSLFNEFSTFLLGNIDGITSEKFTIPLIPTLVVIGFVMVASWKFFDDIIAISFGRLKLGEDLNKMFKIPLPFLLIVFVVISFAEELLFRGFFLWVLPKVFEGDAALYILVIISSLLFAAAHIPNYIKGKGNYLKSIPFFIAALFLAFTFLKFGLLAATFVHCTQNFIAIFSHRFEKRFIREEL